MFYLKIEKKLRKCPLPTATICFYVRTSHCESGFDTHTHSCVTYDIVRRNNCGQGMCTRGCYSSSHNCTPALPLQLIHFPVLSIKLNAEVPQRETKSRVRERERNEQGRAPRRRSVHCVSTRPIIEPIFPHNNCDFLS